MKLTESTLRQLIRQVIREADDSGKYTHIGYGKYKEKGKEKDSDAQTFQKTDSGKFEPVGGDAGGEKEKPEPKVTKIDTDPFGDKDSETGKDYMRKFMGTDEPEDDEKHDKQADNIMSITNDDVKFDGYNDNEQPEFISTKDSNKKYIVNQAGTIWSYDGQNYKMIGKTSTDKPKGTAPNKLSYDNVGDYDKNWAGEPENEYGTDNAKYIMDDFTEAGLKDGEDFKVSFRSGDDIPEYILPISDKAKALIRGYSTAEEDEDEWEESIIPELKEEFKQYGFAQKAKNWKHAL